MQILERDPRNDTTAASIVPVSRETQKIVDVAFRSYERRLYHAALRITGNEDDARDAVQDGLVSALRNAERFRGDAAVASWLYAIVVNAALYQRRRHRARQRGSERYESELASDGNEGSLTARSTHRDPESYLLARVELERALAEIEELPEDKRVLVEQALGGDSCAVIAARAGQPVAAIKSKLWRTRVALRGQIEGRAAA
jgi:RNA polymerase sigma-70 factor (ECF subfamily)